jgi:hypothetical protein
LDADGHLVRVRVRVGVGVRVRLHQVRLHQVRVHQVRVRARVGCRCVRVRARVTHVEHERRRARVLPIN